METNFPFPRPRLFPPPIQWPTPPKAEFPNPTKNNPSVITKGPCWDDQLNVEKQRRDSGSLLSWAPHNSGSKKSPPKSWGYLKNRLNGPPSVLPYLSTWQGNSFFGVHNFAGESQGVRKNPKVREGQAIVLPQNKDPGEAKRNPHHSAGHKRQALRWYRVFRSYPSPRKRKKTTKGARPMRVKVKP